MAKQIALRVPKSLYERVVAQARAEGVSINQYIVYVLSSHVGGPRQDGMDVDGEGQQKARKNGP